MSGFPKTIGRYFPNNVLYFLLSADDKLIDEAANFAARDNINEGRIFVSENDRE